MIGQLAGLAGAVPALQHARTLGAQAMGWKAALVTRGANAPLLVENVPQPDFVETNLTDLAFALISRFHTP